MVIDRILLPIKLHYFIRYAATASLSLFLPSIIREKGVPPQGIGLLYTIFPFVSLVSNSISGGIADAFKIHRAMFIFSLVLMNFGFTAVYFLPPVNVAEKSPIFSNLSNLIPESYVKEQDIALIDIVTKWSFWLVFLCILIQYVGLNSSILFTDAVCFKILGEKHHKYGEQRMWGTIGMGIFSLIIGALVDWYSIGLPSQDYFPAFLICFVLLLMDILLVFKMPIPSKTEDSLNLKTLGKVLKSFKSIIFMLTIVVYGFSLGIIWTFHLMLVEDIALQYDENFSSLKFLQGILMFVQTFGGELPFLFLSGSIIKRLGPETLFSLCLTTISVRYFMYYWLSNPWYFIPVEILNGPAYGLFLANMVAYGTKIAPPGALATIHAVMRACISLGQASGGLIGGSFYHHYGGRNTFLFSSLIVGGFTVLYTIVQAFYRILHVSPVKEKEDFICSSKLLEINQEILITKKQLKDYSSESNQENQISPL